MAQESYGNDAAYYVCMLRERIRCAQQKKTLVRNTEYEKICYAY